MHRTEQGTAPLARTCILLLLGYATLLAGVTLARQSMSPHSTARLATIDSLVERGTFAIDGSPFVGTVDKVYVGGHYYAAQPPLTAVAGALVYYPLRHLGMRLNAGRNLTYVAVTFAMNALTTIIGLIFFFRSLRFSDLPRRWHLPLTASLALGTLVLPFSTTLNSHAFCAALMAIGLYYFLAGQESEQPRGAAFWSGLAFASACAADHAMLAFYGLFAVCILPRRDRWRHLLWFLLPGILTMAPTCAYYYAVGHSILPFNVRPELYVYPGSQWKPTGEAGTRLTGGSWNSLGFAARYGALMLVGVRRGFLIYNPASFLALYGLARTIRLRRKYWREGAAVATGSAAIVCYYAFSSSNYSGATYSIRWFIPFLPLWWFFGATALENIGTWGPWKKRLAAGLCALSVFYALAGAMDPWPYEWRGAEVPLINIRDALWEFRQSLIDHHLLGR